MDLSDTVSTHEVLKTVVVVFAAVPNCDGTQIEKELPEIDFSMAALSSLLIEENSEELERTMQAANCQPLQHIPTNQVQCQEAAPEAAVAQVCSARD